MFYYKVNFNFLSSLKTAYYSPYIIYNHYDFSQFPIVFFISLYTTKLINDKFLQYFTVIIISEHL